MLGVRKRGWGKRERRGRKRERVGERHRLETSKRENGRWGGGGGGVERKTVGMARED